MSAVLTAPSAAKFTPDDLLQLPDQGLGYELVDGELRERNVSTLSTLVAGEVLGQLRDHVKPRHLGWFFTEGGSFRCFPDDKNKVRRADAAFTRLHRMTREQALRKGHCTVVPDLVVEIISPNDLADDVNEKRIEWLEAGAELVWVIHPIRQSIHAYRATGDVRLFQGSDVLTAEPVLPDFKVPVAELFKLADATE